MRIHLMPPLIVFLAAPIFAEEPATKPASYETLLGSSHLVCAGKLVDKIEDTGAGWHKAMLQVHGTIYAANGESGTASLPLRFSDVDGYKAGQDGVWFIEKTADGFEAHGERYRPAAEKPEVIKAAEPWLETQITEQLKLVKPAFEKDPDGDQPETWKLMRRLFALGSNEIYFPAFKDRKTDHPSQGHLAEMYQALGVDLGVVPYPKTVEEKTAAVAAMRNSHSASQLAPIPAIGSPKFDESFQMHLSLYLYERFSILRTTLAADDERFDSFRNDLAKNLPPDTKLTRMAAFKLCLKRENESVKVHQ